MGEPVTFCLLTLGAVGCSDAPNILIILCDDMGYGDFFNITLLPYDESHFTPYGPGCFGPLWGGSSLAADG